MARRNAEPGEHMLLTDEVVERRGSRRTARRVLGLALTRRFGEEVGHARSMLPAG